MGDKPTKHHLAEKRRGTMFGLIESLDKRAMTLEAAGDHEFAIELRAAVHCISCAMNMMHAQFDIELACDELDQLLELDEREAPAR
jgi:hypothetical protein